MSKHTTPQRRYWQRPAIHLLGNNLAALLGLGLLVALPALGAETIELQNLFDNPADLSDEGTPEKGLFYGGGGLFADDQDKLLDNALILNQEGDRLEARSRGLILIPGDEQPLIDAMKRTDQNRTHFRSNIDFALLEKGNTRSNWMLSTQFDATGRFYYDPDDENRLRFAMLTSLFNASELESHMRVSAVHHIRLGWNYRFRLDALPNTQLAITPKFQVVSLIERRIDQADYEEKEVFRFSRDLNDHYQLNLDIGLRHQLGPVGLQLVVTDLYNQKLEGVLGGRYQQRSQIRAGLDYRRPWGELKLMSDLTPSAGFGELAQRRDTTLSTKVILGKHFAITSGINIVRDHDEQHSYKLGLQYQNRDLRILIEGHSGGNRELGFQLGFQLPI